MNCERAEIYLSAFLDTALDPRLSQQVRAHVEDCVHCRTILDDYRSFDHLLATSARVEPPDTLRVRLFESDEFRRIAAAREAGIDLSGEPDVETTLKAPELPELADDLPLDPDELLLPDAADLPELDAAIAAMSAGDSPAAGQTVDGNLFARLRASMSSIHAPALPKALLPVAAALTLALGATLLVRQGLFPSGASTVPGLSTTLGNPGQQGIPLAAGPRVVYLHDGILWSAPENGPGIAQPLTPSGHGGVSVGAWSVAPSAHQVAYLDTSTGTLHVVRGDGLDDHIVASSVSGGIAWSPDNSRLAYLAAAGGGHVLHVVDSAGGNDITISSGGADAANATWSADSGWIAYTETHDGATGIWAYDLAANMAHQLAAPDSVTAGTVTQLNWLGDARHRAATWATTDATGGIAAVFSASTDSAMRQLTPSGARYTAAAFSADRGAWLLGDRTSLILLSVVDGSRTTVATLDTPASGIFWSAGGVAAITRGNTLSLWSAAAGTSTVNTGISSGVAPVWSADGQSLVYATAGGVKLAQMSGARVTTTTVLHATDVATLSWAPDGHSIVVVTSAGIVLIGPDGAHAKLVDHHTPDGGVLAWSVAG